ncbi:MAG: threonine/serine exporter family protein [Helicobacteraceae bacterium]
MADFVILVFWDAFFASIAGLGFAYLSNTPRHTLFLSALLAAFGHSFRWSLLNFWSANIVLATFLSALIIGIFGMALAKKVKTPVEIIAFPALLPMIPGIYAYKSILAIFSFMRSDDTMLKAKYLVLFFENVLTTTFVSIALAVGVSMTLLIFYEESLMVTRRSTYHKKG